MTGFLTKKENNCNTNVNYNDGLYAFHFLYWQKLGTTVQDDIWYDDRLPESKYRIQDNKTNNQV